MQTQDNNSDTHENQSVNHTCEYTIMKFLISIQDILFNLTEEKIELSVQQSMELFDTNYPYTYNSIICNLIYNSFYSQRKKVCIYLKYLRAIQAKEKEVNASLPNILKCFKQYISKAKTKEADYLIKEMNENNFDDLLSETFSENINRNDIIKIIRNDEIEKLQEISSQNDFNFNQTIEPSHCERYSFINHTMILIDYAAFFDQLNVSNT